MSWKVKRRTMGNVIFSLHLATRAFPLPCWQSFWCFWLFWILLCNNDDKSNFVVGKLSGLIIGDFLTLQWLELSPQCNATMLLCTNGHDCGFLFVPSCSLHAVHGHFGDVQDDYLPQNIVVAITDFRNFGVRYCFQEQEHCFWGFFFWFFYTPAQQSWRGLSVCLSIYGQNCVSSVSSTILAGSISYLHILSSNFRWCVACKVFFNIKMIKVLANSLNL